MLRSILTVFFTALFLLVTLPVLGILSLIGKKHPAARDHAAMACIHFAFRGILWFSGVRITVRGEENIPRDHAALLVGNHRSIYDVIATYTLMTRPTGYIAKDSMQKIPVFRVWMRDIGCLFLDRSDLKAGMRMILDAIQQVKAGQNVFIFPEGTRGRSESDTDLLPFHEGSMRVATKTGCPVVPVAITNSAQILEAHSPRLKSTHIIIEFLSPIDPKTLPKEEQKHLGARTHDLIAAAVGANRALV